jgi:hypothetical protein
MSKHETENYVVLTDEETVKLVSGLAGCDDWTSLQALSGQLSEVPPAPVFSGETRPKVYRKDHVSGWVKKYADKIKPPAVHKDGVGSLPSQVKLSEAGDYAVSFDNAGVYQGHSASEKL